MLSGRSFDRKRRCSLIRRPSVHVQSLLLATVATACAHSSPTLTSARVLPAGHSSIDVGGAYSAPVAEPVLASALEANARVLADPSNVTADDRVALTRALQVFAPTANGTAEYLAARVGLAHSTELSFALLSLHVLRVGARHAFWRDQDNKWTWTFGGNFRGGYDLASYGVVLNAATLRQGVIAGGEVSTQLGRSSSDIYDVWVGARFGYVYGAATVTHPALTMGTLSGQLHRAELGTNLGLRVGFGRIAALLELEVLTTLFWASSNGNDTRTQGVIVSLIPAGALSFGF